MIQDIAPHHFSVAYKPAAPRPSDRIVVFSGREILLKADNSLPCICEFDSRFPADSFLFLFIIDDVSYFMLQTDTAGDLPLPENLTGISARAMRSLQDKVTVFAGFTAIHLRGWYRASRFCGYCGNLMKPGIDERKVVCPVCHAEVYPRINPAVIVAVYDGDRLLMTRYAGRDVSWYVLVAGFVEIGESAEDTVRREVMEETGVRVKNIRYYGSQPWGTPGNLTLGYTAELDGDDAVTVDTTELDDARWFKRDEIPVPNDTVSITSAMIRAFTEGKF